jgi:hypothetical protein
MKILSIVRQGLAVARKPRSLWLFGFFVGLGSTGSGGGTEGGPAVQPGVVAETGATVGVLVPLAFVILVIVIAGLIMRFLSEAALIEGVRRITRGEEFTLRQGFGDGWSHVGTVMLITLAYIATSVGSVLVLALPCLLVAALTGFTGAVVILAILAGLAAMPWLITLYIGYAFALRIAVLENRRVVDAIGKARLLLHGRILQGLKLMIATLLGTLLIVLVGIVLIAPFALLVAGLQEVAGPAIVIASIPFLLAAVAVIVAVIGTYQSSVWTIGYLEQAEA